MPLSELTQYTQFFVNGLIAGSIYALVASGFSLIYSTNRFVHLAHGASVTLGGYLLFTLFSQLNLPFFIAFFLVIGLSGLFGFLLHRILYLPLSNKGATSVILLIASIGALLFIQNIIQIFYGADIQQINYDGLSGKVEFLNAAITHTQITIVVLAILLFIGLYYFIQKTRLGRDMRAVADNEELASIVGINHIRVSDYSFIIGSSIAGVAGILIGLVQNLLPTMGMNLVIKGFTGAVIGGITFVPGSILGSYFLGFSEHLTIGLLGLPSGYKHAIGFVLLFIFLLIRPQGIFGFSKETEGDRN